jgi:hypothetical protein
MTLQTPIQSTLLVAKTGKTQQISLFDEKNEEFGLKINFLSLNKTESRDIRMKMTILVFT